MLDEQRYAHLADEAFRRIIEGFDEVDVDAAEAEHAGDVVTITLANGKRIVVNTQKPTRQIWLAGGATAWHFSWDDASGRWLDDKGRGDDLYSAVGKLARELGGVIGEVPVMKVLVADKLEASGLDAMRAAGLEVVVGSLADLATHRPDILVVRSTKVGADCFSTPSPLGLVIRAGAGVDTIDVEAASAQGVFVANCPGKNAIAVAELAWALILACDRRVPQQTAELRAGRWNKKEYGKARGLHGGTLGIVGLGTIGCEVARRGRAFGMKVVAWSPSLTGERCEELGVRRAASLVELAREADVVSLHVAGGAGTKNLVDEAFVAALKPGAILVNTARGSVLDEAAVMRAIEAKGLRVGLDVYAGEPAGGEAEFRSPLSSHPAVVGTHHVGASTDQAQLAIAAEAVRIAVTYATTGQVLHCVNRNPSVGPATLLTVRHKNRPGVLSRVFKVLSDAGINVEEMENVVTRGGEAASARIQLAQAPDAAQIAAIRASCEHILDVATAPVDAPSAAR